jgi:hypothetical protein
MLCEYLNDIYENHIKANLIEDEFRYYQPDIEHFKSLWKQVNFVITSVEREITTYYIDDEIFLEINHINHYYCWPSSKYFKYDSPGYKYIIGDFFGVVFNNCRITLTESYDYNCNKYNDYKHLIKKPYSHAL